MAEHVINQVSAVMSLAMALHAQHSVPLVLLPWMWYLRAR
jgi:hypothetical protein